MTPGITNMMVKYAADKLETVEEIYISHGAFRPIAFSPAIAETTIVEYDPNLDSRLVYEDGKFVQVPHFASPKIIDLPEPYGAHLQYIIPHPETETLAKSMADKGVRRIEVRGPGRHPTCNCCEFCTTGDFYGTIWLKSVERKLASWTLSCNNGRYRAIFDTV